MNDEFQDGCTGEEMLHVLQRTSSFTSFINRHMSQRIAFLYLNKFINLAFWSNFLLLVYSKELFVDYMVYLSKTWTYKYERPQNIIMGTM